MMTFDGDHRWVFPVVANSCEYATLSEYFGGLKEKAIEVLTDMGDIESEHEMGKYRNKNKNVKI